MAFNDIFRLRIHARLHGAEIINVWHFVQEVPGEPGAQSLADDVRDNLLAPLRARASADMTFEFVEAVKIVPYGEGPVTAAWPSNTLGTVTGVSGSATLAEVITIYTGSIGRRHRGRMYLAGVQQVRASGGLIIPSQTTATQALATAIYGRYIAASHPSSFSLGVWSKAIAGPDPPWPTSAFTRATSLTVRTIVRNQRRRQVGVGR